MNIASAAEYLGLSSSYLWELARNGVVPSFRYSPRGNIMFDKQDLDTWLEARKKAAREGKT
jgi:excisionase family DNA binding protein